MGEGHCFIVACWGEDWHNESQGRKREERRMEFRYNDSIRIASSRKFNKMLCPPVALLSKVYGVSLTYPLSTNIPFPTPGLLNTPEFPARLPVQLLTFHLPSTVTYS
jgi:hypothetical protein